MMDVSVIVCTKNEENNISLCLESIKKNNPKEIIVVDGKSDDKTVEISKKFTDKIYNDPGKGLALARNIGAENAKGKYLLYVGPDNLLEKNTIKQMIEYMDKNGFAGVSCQTIYKNTSTYIARCMNIYKRTRYYPGERDVIGTPWLYPKELLIKFPFDNKMSFSDDTDLCHRLKKEGLKVGISDAICYEQGYIGSKDIAARWKMYGKSDAQFYNKYSHEMKFVRKIKSLLHPVTAETTSVMKSNKVKFEKRLYILPFLLMITFYRYIGWIKNRNK